ncbi:MAG: hypothetical protein ONA69_06370, partial [candidate division KSB1 bacterium]|nr:hypothetical protein [candidate division KSB1 bacterium]
AARQLRGDELARMAAHGVLRLVVLMSCYTAAGQSEARLAREAEICYATLAMVTDFDCWYEAESGHTVSVELVLSYMEKNIKTAKEMLRRTIAKIDPEVDCSCRHALAGAILTDRSYWPEETVRKLYPLIKNYL